MACLNMSPRISFSNDFADPQQSINPNNYKEAPASSDFEFSTPHKAMISADELFLKGKLLPLKENSPKFTTLRDELLAGEDDCYEDVETISLAKGASRWKQKLGLKRSRGVVPKKGGKNVNGGLERIDEMKGDENAGFEDGFANIKGEGGVF